MKTMSAFLLASALTASTTFAQDSRTKIIGGDLLEARLPQVRPISSVSSFCTATLIGPKVIVTAAHCKSAVPGRIEFVPHPDYKDEWDEDRGFAVIHDVAIGILPAPDELPPITVGKHDPELSERLLLTGIGRPRAYERQFAFMPTIFANDLGYVVRDAVNRIALDSGDSGGGAFILEPDDHVTLIGINSTSTRDRDRTDDSPRWGQPYTSGIARVMEKTANGELSFLESVAKERGLQICGINLECDPVKFEH